MKRTPYEYMLGFLDFANRYFDSAKGKTFGNICARIGAACIVFLASLYIIVNIGFILHISVNVAWFILALAIAFWSIIYRNSNKIISFSIFALVFVISTYIAYKLYDVSWDGREYHQIAIFYIANGWNPIYQKIADLIELKPFLSHEIWVEHYLKFAEITAGVFYKTFGNIESGKAINYIMAFGAIAYSISVLIKLKINIFASVILSILAVLSPVAMAQINTFYIDDLLGSMLVIAFASIVDIEISRNRDKSTFLPYMMFILSLFIASSIKLNGLGYAGFIGVGYFLYRFFFFGFLQSRAIILSGVAVIALVGITNINPFFTNLKDGKHIAYPLFGKNKVDIITGNMPSNFRDLNKTERFIVSIFSKTQNVIIESSELKIPFIKTSDEYTDADTRVAGFGPHFSGVLILSFIFWLLHYKEFARKEVVGMFVLIFGSVLINPGLWWARYVPQMWLIPLILVIYSYKFYPKLCQSFLRLCIIYLLVACVIFTKIPTDSYTKSVRNFIATIETQISSKPESTIVMFFERNSMEKSFALKLMDKGINVRIIDKAEFEQLQKFGLHFMEVPSHILLLFSNKVYYVVADQKDLLQK